MKPHHIVEDLHLTVFQYREVEVEEGGSAYSFMTTCHWIVCLANLQVEYNVTWDPVEGALSPEPGAINPELEDLLCVSDSRGLNKWWWNQQTGLHPSTWRTLTFHAPIASQHRQLFFFFLHFTNLVSPSPNTGAWKPHCGSVHLPGPRHRPATLSCGPTGSHGHESTLLRAQISWDWLWTLSGWGRFHPQQCEDSTEAESVMAVPPRSGGGGGGLTSMCLFGQTNNETTHQHGYWGNPRTCWCGQTALPVLSQAPQHCPPPPQGTPQWLQSGTCS